MIGIYKITNIINGKTYIGQSVNIEKRFKTHKTNAFNKKNKEYNKLLYRAFRKYGIENFIFEIIEECPKEMLNEKESHYIKLYNSNINGYNLTNGGEYEIFGQKGEKHNNHKLLEQDVYNIREDYNNHKYYLDVYNNYKHKINFSGFVKVWKGETWKEVHYDVYTQENKDYYIFQRNSHKGSKNGRALLTEEDVVEIRIRKNNGESLQEVYKDFPQISISGFRNIWNNKSWKHIAI